MSTTQEAQRARVREAYGEIARTRVAPSKCCGKDSHGGDYSAAEIASVPEGAFLGEGSGNPVRAARLVPGETVIDLGSGAGMDAFLAANRVGSEGRVIGFDMTPDMLARSRGLLADSGYSNVEFRESDIADLPAENDSVDAVLSNCVINLTPDKAAVYREIFRVLRPGGRIAIADIVLRGEARLVYDNADRIPGCSCIRTANEEAQYLELVREAGFADVTIFAERPAASDAELRGFAEVLGLDPANPQVEARAVTLVATKPAA